MKVLEVVVVVVMKVLEVVLVVVMKVFEVVVVVVVRRTRQVGSVEYTVNNADVGVTFILYLFQLVTVGAMESCGFEDLWIWSQFN